MKITQLSVLAQKRIERIIEWVSDFETSEELLLKVDEIMSRMRFGVNADLFERSLHELGAALGFGVQRPDKEWKEGPDNLWVLRDSQYILFECKNQVDRNRSEVNKRETGQMNNSCAWFRKHYPGVKVTNILIIWTKTVARSAGFTEDVEIMQSRKLENLAKNVQQFFQEFRDLDLKDLSEAKIKGMLDTHQLTVDDLVTRCSDEPKQL